MLTINNCAHLSTPNPLTVALAAFILVGILVSYLPQHIKIITRRSSEGLSPWWVLLGGLSSIAAIGNILVLPASRADVQCCKEVSGGACAAALLGIAQIGLQWACFMFIVMLFLIFFPTTTTTDLTTSASSITKTSPPKRRDAITVGILTLLTLLIVAMVSITTIAAYPSKTQIWADTLGTIAGTLAMIQYVPQIYFTWRLGSIKSLSIITMLIQVPGAFLFAFSLGLRVGWEGWSTWLVYVVTGILQGVLLGLAVSYFLAGRRRRGDAVGGGGGERQGGVGDDVDGTADNEDDDTEANERTVLLANGQQQHQQYQRSKNRPMMGTERSSRGEASQRQLGMLYAATPPEHDSDRSSSGRG